MGCAGCHGADREGLGELPSLLNLQSKFDTIELKKIITEGKNSMPSFAQIEGKALTELTDFCWNRRILPERKSQLQTLIQIFRL